MSRRRVCVVTSGHLAGCPRMLKAADALVEAGYEVRVVSTISMAGSAAADRALHASRGWRWCTVSHERGQAPLGWARSGVRRRFAWTRARREPERVSLDVAAAALGRVHEELIDAVLESPADLIYAGTVGALAAAAAAGRRAGIPHAVDFEDFHCAEHDPAGDGAVFNVLARRLMQDVAKDAAFVTAGSAAIAEACADQFGVEVTPIHNVFPLPKTQPTQCRSAASPLRLYWFSQTIGPGRGIEDAIGAAALLRRPVELALRGSVHPAYARALAQLAGARAPQLTLRLLEIASPDQMVDSCRAHDIGICAEQGHPPNRALNLPNKATTYILAGLPVVLTDIPGHRPLARDLGEGAIVFAPGDVAALADGLQRLLDSSGAFARAGEAAWHAAVSRWHWEHPDERDALLRLVDAVAA